MSSYQDFLHAIQARFTAALAAGGNLLFETDAVGLFDAYLANLPADQRQHHNCSCCRAFVKTFGGLVTIDAAGRVVDGSGRRTTITITATSRSTTTATAAAAAIARMRWRLRRVAVRLRGRDLPAIA